MEDPQDGKGKPLIDGSPLIVSQQGQAVETDSFWYSLTRACASVLRASVVRTWIIFFFHEALAPTLRATARGYANFA